MIIDNHIHIFPDQAGPDVGPDSARHVAQLQKSVADFWGRMVSSHTDPKFIPEPDEDVDFTVGRHGRYYWRKHGEGCWLQRGPAFMARMESTPEQIIAHMDAVGVNMAVIQADYNYVDFDTGRESLLPGRCEDSPRPLHRNCRRRLPALPLRRLSSRTDCQPHPRSGGLQVPSPVPRWRGHSRPSRRPSLRPLMAGNGPPRRPGLRQYWLLYQGQLSGAAQGPQISPGPLP